MINDSLSLRGSLQIYVSDELVREINNTVVTTGKEYVAAVLGTGLSFAGNFMQLGTGTNPVNVSNTGLQTPVGTRVSGTLSATGATFKVEAVFDAGNPSTQEDITEAGLFTALSGGNLFARTVFSPVGKDVDDSLRIIWSITVA